MNTQMLHPELAIVTGASSGIGLAAVELLLGHASTRVLAVSRHAASAPGLRALQESHADRLHCTDVDLTDPAALQRVPEAARMLGARVDLLLNCAGLLHDKGMRPEKSIAQVRMETLQRGFALNAFAPILLAQALLPLMRDGRRSVFASLSARVGSIGDNQLGGWHAYRAAKAAQNQLLRTFAIELARINPQAVCLLLHPGTVDTPLSEPFKANVPAERLFSPKRAASQLLEICLRAGPEDSGSFIAWDGSRIPW
jgi:NAD(P)-dependent dehydrogenase (short-subunit alcohol dehydrogenase family)